MSRSRKLGLEAMMWGLMAAPVFGTDAVAQVVEAEEEASAMLEIQLAEREREEEARLNLWLAAYHELPTLAYLEGELTDARERLWRVIESDASDQLRVSRALDILVAGGHTPRLERHLLATLESNVFSEMEKHRALLWLAELKVESVREVAVRWSETQGPRHWTGVEALSLLGE